MANAVYSLSYGDHWGFNTWVAEIWSRATNNNPTIDIKGAASPIVINTRTVDDLFSPVVIKEAVFEVVSETDLYFKDFFTADQGDWILKLYKNGSLYWTGQNVTESYSEPYLITPYKSQIKFSDLGDLDFLYFQPSATTFYTGYKSLSEIMFLCTNKLSYQLDAIELINVINTEGWNNATVTNKSCLANTFLDASVFMDYKDNKEQAITCMEVLRRVFYSLGCRIFQNKVDGEACRWHILRIEEATNASSDVTGTFRLDHTTYAADTQATITLGREITNGTTYLDICPINQNQDLGMSGRYNKISHKYTTQELIRDRDELIYNHDFSKGVKTAHGTSYFPKFFQQSTDIPSTVACAVVTPPTTYNQVTNIRNLEFRAMTPASMTAFRNQQLSPSYTLSTRYIRTTGTESGDASDIQQALMSNVQITTADKLRFKVKGTIIKGVDYGYANANGYNNQTYITAPHFAFRFYFKMTLSNGTIYYLGMTNTASFWYTLANSANPQNAFIQTNVGTPGFSPNTFSGVKYHKDSFLIEMDSPYFPLNDIVSMSYRFYLPVKASGTTGYMQPTGLCDVILEDLSLKYISDNDFTDDIIKSLTVFSVSDFKELTYDYFVRFGDGPTEICMSSYRYGIVSASDKYKKTSTWRKLDDATSYSARDVFNINPAQSLICSYQRKITGDYLGIFDILETPIIDDGVDEKRYIIMGDSFNTSTSVHSLDLLEITPTVITSVQYDEGERVAAPPIATDSANAQNFSNQTFLSSSLNNLVVLNTPVTANNLNKNTKYPG